MLRKLLILVFSILVIASTNNALASTYYSYGDDVSIRSGASTRCERLGYLMVNDKIEIDRVKNNWGYSSTVRTEDIGGWVSMDWLSSEPVEIVDNEIYIVNHNRVNLREKPNGEQIKRVNRGHELVVEMFICDEDSVWWAKTTSGWIMCEFIDKEETVSGM